MDLLFGSAATGLVLAGSSKREMRVSGHRGELQAHLRQLHGKSGQPTLSGCAIIATEVI